MRKQRSSNHHLQSQPQSTEEKQLLFQNIAITTEKIQADKPLDKKEFMVMMQGYE